MAIQDKQDSKDTLAVVTNKDVTTHAVEQVLKVLVELQAVVLQVNIVLLEMVLGIVRNHE